jgi:hypothetical protein
MNCTKLLPALLLSLAIAGCASGPKHSELASAIPALKAGEGRIYFYRSNSMLGAAVQPSVSLNGNVVGDSKPGGFFFVDAKAGPMEVTTATEVEKKLTFTLEPRQTRYVRTVIGMGVFMGRVYPELVDPTEGEAELRQMSYIGSALKK